MRAGASDPPSGASWAGPRELTQVQTRILGCLIEKQRTTPESYPLTINSLRLACNQSTNRDPVVDYSEAEVREAAAALGRRRLVRLASGQGSRATKYRHVANEALGLDDEELAVLAVLMLRGPQTPGELKARAERLHPFADLRAVAGALERLASRELAASLGRRAGQKEKRYTQLLGPGGDSPEEAGGALENASAAVAGPAPTDVPAPSDAEDLEPEPAPSGGSNLEGRVSGLEREVGELRETVDALRRELGG